MSKHRLELFSDGVFAIVLTLLVLELKVPAAHGVAGVREIGPALAVHAAAFFMVGAFWYMHHGGFARVIEVTTRTLLWNLVALFWVTLLPFAALNAAERPLEPLGPSLLAGCCGLTLLTFVIVRLSAHSAIDDNPHMRAWKRSRMLMGSGIGIAAVICGGLAWVSPWIGYAGALVAVALAVGLPSPADAEKAFEAKGE